jgi:hypothetical protein
MCLQRERDYARAVNPSTELRIAWIADLKLENVSLFYIHPWVVVVHRQLRCTKLYFLDPCNGAILDSPEFHHGVDERGTAAASRPHGIIYVLFDPVVLLIDVKKRRHRVVALPIHRVSQRQFYDPIILSFDELAFLPQEDQAPDLNIVDTASGAIIRSLQVGHTGLPGRFYGISYPDDMILTFSFRERRVSLISAKNGKEISTMQLQGEEKVGGFVMQNPFVIKVDIAAESGLGQSVLLDIRDRSTRIFASDIKVLSGPSRIIDKATLYKYLGEEINARQSAPFWEVREDGSGVTLCPMESSNATYYRRVGCRFRHFYPYESDSRIGPFHDAFGAVEWFAAETRICDVGSDFSIYFLRPKGTVVRSIFSDPHVLHPAV